MFVFICDVISKKVPYGGKHVISRAPDKDHFLFSRMPVSSPNPLFDHLLELSHSDDSNKWSNRGFGEEITELSKFNFTNLIWSHA